MAPALKQCPSSVRLARAPIQPTTQVPHVQRRAMVAGGMSAIMMPFAAPNEALAGWDGPANFLKSRQIANQGKLIAPFEVSITRLKDAQSMLNTSTTSELYTDALELVRRASCNCYAFEAFDNASLDTRASLITQNLKLADPCTFRIIVKNTTMLRDLDDPLRMAAYDRLAEVIRSFELLDGALLQAGELDSETRENVAPLIQLAIENTTALKQLVTKNIVSA